MRTRKIAIAILGAACLLPLAAAPSTAVIASRYGSLPLSFEPNRGQAESNVRFLAHGAGNAVFLSPRSATFASLGTHTSVVRMDVLGNAAPAMRAEDKLPGIANYLTGSSQATWLANLPTYRRIVSPGVYPGIDLIYYGDRSSLEYDFVISPHADPSRIELRFTGARPTLNAAGELILTPEMRFRRPRLYQEIDGARTPVEGGFIVSASSHRVSFRVGSYDRARALIIDPVLLYSSYFGGSSQQSTINGMTLNAAGQLYVTGVTNAVDFPTTPGAFQGTCPAPETGTTKCGVSSLSAAFVSKIAADGQSVVYSTYLGGSGSGPGVGGSAVSIGGNGADSAASIAVTSKDEAWVLGSTNSNNFPVTPDAFSLYCLPASASFDFNNRVYVGQMSSCARISGGEYIYSDAKSLFLVKLNPSGTNILYGTFFGGTQGAIPGQIALDPAGNVYFSGTARNATNGPASATGQYPFPATGSAFQTAAQENAFSPFVTELSADGHSLLYSSFLSATKGDAFGGPIALAAGKIFLGGEAQSPSLPTTPGALSKTCPNNGTQCALNGFVAEFDPAKSGAQSLVFSTYLNGQHVASAGLPFATSTVNALAADSSGNVYAAGSNQYRDFPTTTGVFQSTCFVNRNDACTTGYVTKLSPSGSLLWSTFYGSPGGNGQFGVAALALDSSNNVFITNLADGGGDVPTVNGVMNYSSGSSYIAELSADGAHLLFGTFFGNGAAVYPTGIRVDSAGNIYVAGYTSGTLPLVNALQKGNAGGFQEGFFAKISTTAIAPGAIVIVSAASGLPGAAAPGSIVSAYGANLATGTASNTVVPLPTNLAGTSVTLVDANNVIFSASMIFASPGQVNFLVPANAAKGAATVTVTSADGTKSTTTLNIAAVSPGLFVLNSAGLVAANVLDFNTGGGQSSTNTFQVVNGAIVPLPVNLGPPAQQVFLVLYGTGISGRSALANVTVSIGGRVLPALYAGPQGEAGLDQVNVLVPASLAGSGDNTVTITVDGAISNVAHVTIL